jgi:hypothetical protein
LFRDYLPAASVANAWVRDFAANNRHGLAAAGATLDFVMAVPESA